jgi:hypothetical protein
MELLFFFFFFIVLLFICAYKAWVISSPCPHPIPYHPLHPLPLPHPLNTQQKLFCPKNMELLERLKRKDLVANVKLIWKFAALQIMI